MGKITTDRTKMNPALGTMPVLQYALPTQLQVDESYQRSIESGESQALIKRIAQHWNWDLCLPLVVSRRADGSMYVIDGQHRLAAARLRGDIAQLPCVVGNYGGVADEAATFVNINQQRRPLTGLELFRSAVTSGDTEACRLMELMAEVGLELAAHTNSTAWKPGQIGAVGCLRAAFRKHGEAVTLDALHVVAQAWAGEVLYYSGTLFPGIAAACAKARADGYGQGWTISYGAKIGAKKQPRWREDLIRFRADYPALSPITACEELMLRAAGFATELQKAAVAKWIKPPVKDPDLRQLATPSANWPVAGEKRWCEQCERQVTGAQAMMCRSEFCKAKPRAAA